jgi:ribose 5-phosphate isomerase B
MSFNKAQDTLYFASDHAGFALKQALVEYYTKQNYHVIDLGTNSEDRVDYPDYGDKLALAVLGNPHASGVGICGTGIGISIALNRHPGIRAALVHDLEYATLAREHNDANVICFGARFLDQKTAITYLNQFLSTEFAQGRHTQRVQKLG